MTPRSFRTADIAIDGGSGDWSQGVVMDEGGRGGGDMRDSVYIMPPPPPRDIGSSASVSGIAVSRSRYLILQELIQGDYKVYFSCDGSK